MRRVVIFAACFLIVANSSLARTNVNWSMNESVIVLYGEKGEALMTTIFKPPGNGPFPLAIMNHGRDFGDSRTQPRARAETIAREFVRRGYLFAVPMRKGFASSSGTEWRSNCDVKQFGRSMGSDVAFALDKLVRRPDIDASRVLILGVSAGAVAAIAYAEKPAPGVRGIVNFSGGIRYMKDCNWRNALLDAMENYGKNVRIPSLWIYASNDSYFDALLVRKMHKQFVRSGASALHVDIGSFETEGHYFSSEYRGVLLWRRHMDTFLRAIDLPWRATYRMLHKGQSVPSETDDSDRYMIPSAVPFLDDAGRAAYVQYLQQPEPRAFALAPGGAYGWAGGRNDAAREAISLCRKHAGSSCRLYAVDDYLVKTSVR